MTDIPPPLTTPAATAAIAVARDAPTLIAGLKAADPALAEQLTGKALVASKSPWGVLAASAVSWAAAKYGLSCAPDVVVSATCWTPETINLVAGFIAMAGGVVGAYVMRYVTASPIAGIFSTASNNQGT